MAYTINFNAPAPKHLAVSNITSQLISYLQPLITPLLFLLLPAASLAQFTVTGRLLNQADTKPVANASVFINNTTIGDRSAADGTFALKKLLPGKYEVIISIVGFDTYNQTIVVNNSNINLPDITIFPKTTALRGVTIKADRSRDNNLDLYFGRFRDQFLGTSDFAAKCKILNPELLDFVYNDNTKTLRATSAGALEIENDALGYMISFELTAFMHNQVTKEFLYTGPVHFTEMEGDPSQQRKWQQNRRQAYEGSLMHFLRAALNDNLEEEGFRVYQLATYGNVQRPADSVIANRIAKFNVKQGSANYNPDSLSFWKKKAKLAKVLITLSRQVLEKSDIVTNTDQPGIFALGCDGGELVIEYDKKREFTDPRRFENLTNLSYQLQRPDDVHLTQIHFKTAYTLFDGNGKAYNSSMFYTGVWAQERVAELLPIDYGENAVKSILADSVLKNIETRINAFADSHLEERVHLHLDRQWYTPGDTIWFKGYTVAGPYHQLSPISGVLYAELINSSDSVVNRLSLPLDSGITHGDFILPLRLKSGEYRLRAYTNAMRNNPDCLYNQKIIIGVPTPTPTNVNGVKTDVPVSNTAPQSIPGRPDVQFFPEGGYLVNGLRSKVAFKAINSAGYAMAIQGVITDEDGNEVANLSTQHLGMGQFPLTPQKGKQYKAKISLADGGNYVLDLPGAKDEGFTLTAISREDSIYVKVAANDVLFNNNQNTSFYLVAQCNGKYYYTASGKLDGQVFTTVVPKNQFPSGIVQFTLFSKNGEPLNERVIFVNNPDGLKLESTAPKPTYAPYENVKIAIAAKKESNQAASGTFSVAVTDETKAPVDEPAEATIFTDLLLTSGLKGYIEKPNYYFVNPTEKTQSDLDLLMLTQGYRRFEWKKVLSGDKTPPTYQPEALLGLSGTITTLSKKPVANGRIKLTSVKDYFSRDTVSDGAGNFTFANVNLYDTTKVVIDAKKANGGNNVLINIKPPQYPAVNNVAYNSINLADSIPPAILTAMQQENGQRPSLKNLIQLKEVKIEKKRNEFFNPKLNDNIKFDGNLNGPGNADQLVLGEKLIGCTTLSECLQSKIFGLKWQNGIPYSMRTSHIKGNGPLALMVDGAQMSINQLDAINPDDVYAIELLTSISYLSIYGSNTPNGALLITLKHGSNVNLSAISVDGLVTYTFNGYYKAREFYSPKYTANPTTATDNRKTIYWNPNIITDENGKATFQFFNAGSPGAYRVVIEGIDGDGNLGRQIFHYKVGNL